jgi:hypothetical protein
MMKELGAATRVRPEGEAISAQRRAILIAYEFLRAGLVKSVTIYGRDLDWPTPAAASPEHELHSPQAPSRCVGIAAGPQK